ncbi:hypothetical protein D3C78_1813040 [compost metagenome]
MTRWQRLVGVAFKLSDDSAGHKEGSFRCLELSLALIADEDLIVDHAALLLSVASY